MEHGLSLLAVLQISIILRQISPYLSIGDILRLGSVTRSLRVLLFEHSGAFRHLDLSTARGATFNLDHPIDRGGVIWRNQRVDESTTEEDFYCGPLRGIFSYLRKVNVLASVRTLILDGQSAPVEVLRDIICDDFNVQILSVIGSKNLNERKFQQVLRYAVRPTRLKDTPKLQGVYIFGTTGRPSIENTPNHSANSIIETAGAQLGVALNRRSHGALQQSLDTEANPWYQNSGKVLLKNAELAAWAATMKACEGVIYFDAVLCRGPRHSAYGLSDTNHRDANAAMFNPDVATIALGGCQICKTIPEGPKSSAEAPSPYLPLLSPIQKHSSSIKLAQKPPSPVRSGHPVDQFLFARCLACCQGRWCAGCRKFWCEDHYNTSSANEGQGGFATNLKVYCGLCVEHCLVDELYQGSDGMWA